MWGFQCSIGACTQVAPINWIDGTANPVVHQLPATSGYPGRSTWIKLFLLQLLPATAVGPRLVYMDCDMLALTSLAPLWEADLQGGAAASRWGTTQHTQHVRNSPFACRKLQAGSSVQCT